MHIKKEMATTALKISYGFFDFTKKADKQT